MRPLPRVGEGEKDGAKIRLDAVRHFQVEKMRLRFKEIREDVIRNPRNPRLTIFTNLPPSPEDHQCAFPFCKNLRIVNSVLCSAHRKQRERGDILKPLREYFRIDGKIACPKHMVIKKPENDGRGHWKCNPCVRERERALRAKRASARILQLSAPGGGELESTG